MKITNKEKNLFRKIRQDLLHRALRGCAKSEKLLKICNKHLKQLSL